MSEEKPTVEWAREREPHPVHIPEHLREKVTVGLVMPVQVGCQDCSYNAKFGTIYCKEHRGW